MTLDIYLHYDRDDIKVSPDFLQYCLEQGDSINIINNANYSDSRCEEYLKHLLEVFDKDFLKANVTFEGFESNLLE